MPLGFLLGLYWICRSVWRGIEILTSYPLLHDKPPKTYWLKPMIICWTHKSAVWTGLNREGTFLLPVVSTEVAALGTGGSSPKMGSLRGWQTGVGCCLGAQPGWGSGASDPLLPLTLWLSVDIWLPHNRWPDSQEMSQENESQACGNLITHIHWESHGVISLCSCLSVKLVKKLPTPHPGLRETAIDHSMGKVSIFCKKAYGKEYMVASIFNEYWVFQLSTLYLF